MLIFPPSLLNIPIGRGSQRDHGRGFKSRVRVLMLLKIHRVESLIYVESVEGFKVRTSEGRKVRCKLRCRPRHLSRCPKL
ncbi:hypothetical protein TNCV_4420231 [Trichonephila clavipes]|nr:hypothetical protein TNCV_4420231 [Trichonephila clavipes]